MFLLPIRYAEEVLAVTDCILRSKLEAEWALSADPDELLLVFNQRSFRLFANFVGKYQKIACT